MLMPFIDLLMPCHCHAAMLSIFRQRDIYAIISLPFSPPPISRRRRFRPPLMIRFRRISHFD